MDHLHSYWRMAYIKAPDRERRGNPFANLRDADEEDALIIDRSEHNAIILNRYPYNAGHLMVLPLREVAQLEGLSEDELADHMQMIIRARQILDRAIQPHGYNIGYNFGKVAGAGIPSHLHCHIVPRWEGDTNFMPVLGETHVLPDSLASMWARLRSCL